jgi:hypothetical protein
MERKQERKLRDDIHKNKVVRLVGGNLDGMVCRESGSDIHFEVVLPGSRLEE